MKAKHYALCEGARVIDASLSRRTLQRRANDHNDRGTNPAFRVIPLQPTVIYPSQTLPRKRVRGR